MDVITWHWYPLEGPGCPLGGFPVAATPQRVITPHTLNMDAPSRSTVLQYAAKYGSNTTRVWLGEMAAASCGGADNVTNAWSGAFYYLDMLGSLGVDGHDAVMRQSLWSDHYGGSPCTGLLNGARDDRECVRMDLQQQPVSPMPTQRMHVPSRSPVVACACADPCAGLIDDNGSHFANPDYWSAILWTRLMDSRVVSVAITPTVVPESSLYRVYARCTLNAKSRGNSSKALFPDAAGGVTVLVLNLAPTSALTVTGFGSLSTSSSVSARPRPPPPPRALCVHGMRQPSTATLWHPKHATSQCVEHPLASGATNLTQQPWPCRELTALPRVAVRSISTQQRHEFVGTSGATSSTLDDVLTSHYVRLNDGAPLVRGATGATPPLAAKAVAAGDALVLPPLSYAFVVFDKAAAAACA